jgi:hypothetical protein
MSEQVPNEDLRTGDVVRVWYSSHYTIDRIEPYAGPLVDIVFAIARFRKGAGPLTGMSLERGGYTERL